jgi:hypothetical protein
MARFQGEIHGAGNALGESVQNSAAAKTVSGF